MKSPSLSVTVVGASTFLTVMPISECRGMGSSAGDWGGGAGVCSSAGVCAAVRPHSETRASVRMTAFRAIFISLVCLVLRPALQQVCNVRDEIGDRLEGFDGAARRSGEINDERSAPRPGYSARENGPFGRSRSFG